MTESLKVLLALTGGLALGIVVEMSASDTLLGIVRFIEPIGTGWTNAIRMTVVPLVMALVVTGIAGEGNLAALGGVGRRLIVIFLALLLAGGFLAIAIGLPAMDRLEIAPGTANALRESALTSSGTTPQPQMPTVAQRIVEVIPVNPIKAAADGAMLPLVFFSILFAAALIRTGGSARATVVSFFSAIAETMMVLVRWILVLAPLGVFALALGLGARMGASAAEAILFYMTVMVAVLGTFTIALYPVVRLLTGTAVRTFFAAMTAAQGIALGSRSSLAALPAVIAGARARLGAGEQVTGFVLPLAVSVFRVNVPMAWVVGVLFLGKLYGVDIGVADLIQLVFLSTFISFSVPGIPSASLFLLAPVLVNMGIPAEGAAILISVDAIPDMFKTLANVTSHGAVATLVGEQRDDNAAAATPAES